MSNNFLEDIEFASKINEEIKKAEQRGIDNSINLTKEFIKQQYGDIEELKQENKQLKEENEQLKYILNDICFSNDNTEIGLRILRKIGYVGFDEETQEYINLPHDNFIVGFDDVRKQIDYRERIDKAIEYIEENSDLVKVDSKKHFDFYYRQMKDVTELLEILKGDSNESN